MTTKEFPIQTERGAAPHPLLIPWSVAEKAYSVYAARYGRSQTLDGLAERGGFAPSEMDGFLPSWRDEVSEITRLRKELADARAALVPSPPESRDTPPRQQQTFEEWWETYDPTPIRKEAMHDAWDAAIAAIAASGAAGATTATGKGAGTP